MPISPPSANLDHIINTLKWATLLSLHLSPFLAPGTTYFYLFEKIFFRVSPCWSPPRDCRRRRACSPCTTWCCGSPRIAPGASNDHRDILWHLHVSSTQYPSHLVDSAAQCHALARARLHLVPQPGACPGHVARGEQQPRHAQHWNMRTLILGVTLLLGAEQALSGSAVCVTLPYCYCCPLHKNCSLTKTQAVTQVRVGCVITSSKYNTLLCSALCAQVYFYVLVLAQSAWSIISSAPNEYRFILPFCPLGPGTLLAMADRWDNELWSHPPQPRHKTLTPASPQPAHTDHSAIVYI